LPPSDQVSTRFIADAMLGSLARKLRALGFDTTYYKAGDDSGMLDLAARENRVVLTSDKLLASRALSRKQRAFLLTGKSDGERVREISDAAMSSGVYLRRGMPLCSLCGGNLETLRRKDISGAVPPSVERRHRLFFRCTACGQIYWRGSHWKKLRSLARQLRVK
jgi:uncharacterized protein